MKHILLIFLVISLNACNQQSSQKLPESKTIAIVGNELVTEDMLKAFLQANGISKPDKELTKKAFDTLIDEVALANMAKRDNIPLTPEQHYTLEYLRIKSLANNAKTDYLLKNNITEEEIQNEYKQANKLAGGEEYHVHHLLYKDEVEAIKLRDSIHSVADYLIIEKKYLDEKQNRNNIGDLGWVSLGQLPKEFRAALTKSPENTVLKDVLNSQFGAHIVYLEAIRPLTPPALEQVKAGVIQTLKAKKFSKVTQLARAKAHVKVKE